MSGMPVWASMSFPSVSIAIRMGGYGPPTTGFSRALRMIGDRLQTAFGDRVAVDYVYNILDLGYRGADILWLVETGQLTLGYQSTSYLTPRIPTSAWSTSRSCSPTRWRHAPPWMGNSARRWRPGSRPGWAIGFSATSRTASAT